MSIVMNRTRPDGPASAGPAWADSGVGTGDGGPSRVHPVLVAAGPSSVRRVGGNPPRRGPGARPQPEACRPARRAALRS